MTNDQAIFISILSDHISKRTTIPQRTLKWKEIVRLSSIHNVEGIVYFQCRQFLSKSDYTALERSYMATVYCHKYYKYLVNIIRERFEENGIPFLIVKGIEVAQYYPVPALRTMGDIDILVKAADKQRAGSALLSLGLTIQQKMKNHEWTYSINGFNVELHDSLLYNEDFNDTRQIAFLNSCWDYERDGVLEWSFHFLFLTAHLCKHIVYKGAGIRQFIDLAVVTKECKELNWSFIEEGLEKMGLLQFARICFGLLDSWFGIKAPIKYEQLDDSFVNEISECIIINGVFGFQNIDNVNNPLLNRYLKITGNRHNKLTLIIQRIFPNYTEMCYRSYCFFLEGRPWLLPIAWMYRWGYLLIHGGGKEIIGILSVPDYAIERRKDELRRWGLID